MIDTILLTKVAGEDRDFSARIIQKIHNRAQAFSENFRSEVKRGNWNSCYYQLLDFYKMITPYAKLSYLNEVKGQIEAISYTDDVQIKRSTCMKVLQRLAQQIQHLQKTNQRHSSQKAL